MEREFKTFRERWKEENPDKFIRIDKFLGSGYANHQARCTWSPNCTAEDLVDYVDDSTGNFGGRLENVKENEDGTESGTVVVYFD
jgi:hypothetical protein